jgi:hypothetical protein
MTRQRNDTVEQLLSTSWDRKLAHDLAAELESLTGERRSTIEEMRRFLAVKAYRELLQRVTAAREGKTSFAALRSVAQDWRQYALERPALSAAAFRSPMSDSPEWRAAYQQMHEFMLSLFAECGVAGDAAEQALHILRSLVRGVVLHEVLGSFLDVDSYDEMYAKAIEVFITGLPALVNPD